MPAFREGKVARVGQWLAASGCRLARLRAHQRLQRFAQRPAAARAGDRPGRDQPVAGARGHRARARLAHPATCSHDQEIHRQTARQVRHGAGAARARAASASRCRRPSTASTRRWSTSAPSRSSRRSPTPATRPTSSAARCATCCVGLRPKDFDVATNATPEQVKALFRRAFIIGRRFRIVHVVFGRGRQDGACPR